MARVMEVYRMLGFPGACGSMGGTHVRWLACSNYLYHSCKGKERYPTLGWLVIVDHNRKVLYVSDVFYGIENDKGMCNIDPLVQSIIAGKLNDLEYSLFNDKGLIARWIFNRQWRIY